MRQYRLAFADGTSIRIDLAYPPIRLAIEPEGRTWHSGTADFQRDRARANRLARSGWALLRYGWPDLRRGSEVAAEVRAFLKNRTLAS